MPHQAIRTTVVGSYPFPGWLELLAEHADEVGPDHVGEALSYRVPAELAP